MSTTAYNVLAHLVLMVHFAFVAYVVLGLVIVWVGYFLRWSFVRNIAFRVTHLLAMGIVVVESLFGVICPLTRWERELRVAAGQTVYEQTFMQYWIHKLMFFDWEPSTFTIIYCTFFLVLVLSFVFAPPRRSAWLGGPKKD